MEFKREQQIWAAGGAQAAAVDSGLRGYMLGVYNYMASALVLTGLTAWAGAHFEPLMQALYRVQDGQLVGLSGLGWVVMLAPLLMVFGLSAGINRLSHGAAQMIFWAFAALMGLSLSSIFFTYTGESIARTFFITAASFAGLSLYGYVTKKDLTAMGSFLVMGVWGLLIASLVNMFLHSSGLSFAVSLLGVGIFAGLTAYDTQRIKSMYYQVEGYSEGIARAALLGALNLYLDFINLFMMLLRFAGDRR